MSNLVDMLDSLNDHAGVADESPAIVLLLKDVERGVRAIEALAARRATRREWIAALAFKGAGGAGSLGAELTRAAPPASCYQSAADEQTLETLFPRADRRSLLCLQAGVYQILDFWDESHTAAQAAADLGEANFSSYWHAIAHRREPDPSNARYWLRRVGRHRVLKSVGDRIARVDWTDEERREIAPFCGRDALDPFTFFDFCSRAARSEALEKPARTIQRIEMLVLLDATLESLE